MIHFPVKQVKLSNTACETLLYIDNNGERIFKAKKKFNTLEEAIQECSRINNKPQTIHKVVPYKCKTCHMFHVGRNGKMNKRSGI